MAIKRERLTVSNVSIGLAGGYKGGLATITIEAAAIRYTLDGTAPVAGVAGDVNAIGHLMQAGGIIQLVGAEHEAAKFIRNGATDAVFEVTYTGC